jgi:hypothetical protein
MPGVGRLAGLENDLGRTGLDPQHILLGNIERGVGNGLSHDHPIDGVVTPTVVGTYLHGPVWPATPRSRSNSSPYPRPEIDLPDQPPSAASTSPRSGRSSS